MRVLNRPALCHERNVKQKKINISKDDPQIRVDRDKSGKSVHV